MRRTLISFAISSLALVAGIGPSAAQQSARVEVGVLNCTVAGGAGFIFGSTKRLDCTLQSGKRREAYTGRIEKFGIDIGFTTTSAISWAVFAPTTNLRSGALAGNYAGATGEATIGVGLGANVLVGGSNKTIALQPLSVQAQQGLNIAAGVAGLQLRAK
jgi:Protein of unknown function (DUF992)